MESSEGGGGGQQQQEHESHESIGQKLQKEWERMVQHANTYPYVWASYSVVYGTFAAYITYRWRKLRQKEDRIRALQRQLQLKYQSQSQSQEASAVKAQPQDQVPSHKTG